MIFHHPLPGTLLYKYYPPETAERVLSTRKIRFSPLIEFNDPFELNTYSVETFSEVDFGHALANEIHDVIHTGEEIGGTGPVVELVKRFIQGDIKDISPYDFAMEVGVAMAKKKFVSAPSPYTRRVHERLAKVMGAFCVSETFDDLLMWAHYASNHEGFVLGIDPSLVGEAFRAMAPVSYQPTYPTKDDPFEAASSLLGRAKSKEDVGAKAVQRMFFTKSEAWSYEREWRAIRDSGCDPNGDHKSFDINAQLEEMPPSAFSALYVGCRTSPKIAAGHVHIARSLNPEIKVFKCRPSFREYSLEFRPYDEAWPNDYPPAELVI